MELQKKQLHLASKVLVPATPAVPAKDGKPGTPEVKAHTVELHGYSNRVVRYRILNTDQMNAISKEAAVRAGENATGRDIYMLQLMISLYTMITEVSEPTDEPMKLEKKHWHKTVATDFEVTGSETAWSTLFTPKDTALLQSVYRRWHEVPQNELEMLVGKEIPLAAEG